MKIFYYLFLFIAILFQSCKTNQQMHNETEFYLGADLSYLNEMVDCGAVFHSEGKEVEPYSYFARSGANIVRVRLWNNPDWTSYSNLQDVTRTIRLSKAEGMKILLDFHYSDTWADPQKQLIPEAWKNIKDIEILGDSVYTYTYKVLISLYEKNLLPEFVQIGNEINSEILMNYHAEENGPINWERNIYLLNRGIEAVKNAISFTGDTVGIMLHIAQPENAFWWFREASEKGIEDFDWIGLSYYPKWSEYGIHKLEIAIDSLIKTYHKRLMIVETAYPYSFVNVDSAANVLGPEAIIPGFPASPEGQKEFMQRLKEITLQAGGEGVIYWEPAWISTRCSTLWGKGSHWENATFFDASNNNEALPVFEFFNGPIK